MEHLFFYVFYVTERLHEFALRGPWILNCEVQMYLVWVKASVAVITD